MPPVKKTVFVDWRGATWSFDPDTEQGKPQGLSDSGLSVTIEGYWPDFVMRDGKPATASTEARNPAVLVRLRGKLPVACRRRSRPAVYCRPRPGRPAADERGYAGQQSGGDLLRRPRQSHLHAQIARHAHAGARHAQGR